LESAPCLAMYLRFVVAQLDPRSEEPAGIFHAFYQLRSQGSLHPYEEERSHLIRDWFNENLAVPIGFTRATRPFYRHPRRTICWFKDSAREHLEWAWSMVAILEDHQVHVRMLKSDRVGYIVYEDAHQILAAPFP
jgi:hypothetical protein